MAADFATGCHNPHCVRASKPADLPSSDDLAVTSVVERHLRPRVLEAQGVNAAECRARAARRGRHRWGMEQSA